MLDQAAVLFQAAGLGQKGKFFVLFIMLILHICFGCYNAFGRAFNFVSNTWPVYEIDAVLKGMVHCDDPLLSFAGKFFYMSYRCYFLCLSFLVNLVREIFKFHVSYGQFSCCHYLDRCFPHILLFLDDHIQISLLSRYY